MGLSFDISPRKALAAPTDLSQTYIQSVVILVISILSLLGAGWIILSFVCFKRLRSFRHQLILGLAVSDFIMAANFLSSTAMNLSGNDIGAPEFDTFCSFNGFMVQTFVIQTDYWVLVVAACTYFILADHRQLSSWAQDHRVVLTCLPWAFSLLWAVVGLIVAGYGTIGPWCWFTSDEVRLLANFVPRWAIIAVMLGMYARLYFVLDRAHNRFVSMEDSSSHPTSGSRIVDDAARSSSRPEASARDADPREPPSHHGPQKPNKKLRRLARLMLMYPIAYILIWTLPTATRIYQATKGSPAPFTLQTMDKSCIVLQGLVDAVIYGINESSLSSWRNLLGRNTVPVIVGMDEVGPRDITNHSRRRHVLRSDLDDATPNNSISSFEMTLHTDYSGTRITGWSADPTTKGTEEDGGIEPMTIVEAGAERIRQRGSGGGIYIQKTVNVTYVK